MQNLIDSPAEADVRFLGYRVEVISYWPPSARKVAAAEAISQRLTTIARGALVRPDIADLLHLSCQLLDDLFAASGRVPCPLPSTENASNGLPDIPRLGAQPDSTSKAPLRSQGLDHRANRPAREHR